ncbi:LANO_0H01882g1_1 [Lachancea nothofagi CBS 11611]|uniref:LANO_0H01882g1_1 n=1 Tax=Lachancea nothofagi CBS 11611 TaxID=1266666 RepID=A0A1G4KLA0_9SACH|nr:LANO_0H01882g1_1 [Lachancea nothofagi CBS 11611]
MTSGLMRHFSRTKSHRDSMFRNLVSQLLQHGSIVSTHEKCQEASRLAERIITMAKNLKKHPNSAKEIQSRLSLAGDNSKLLGRVISEIAPRYHNRPGGYTRVLKLEPRLGDRAKQSVLELVDTPILSKAGSFQRGDLKLWLLCKTAIANETSGSSYSVLTLQNFAKMLKFRPNHSEFFFRDVLAIRRFIKQEMGLSWDKAQEKKLVSQLQDQVLAMPAQPSKEAQNMGYTIVQERPTR